MERALDIEKSRGPGDVRNGGDHKPTENNSGLLGRPGSAKRSTYWNPRGRAANQKQIKLFCKGYCVGSESTGMPGGDDTGEGH